MCYVVEPELLLANYFVGTRKKSISFRNLKALRSRIEREIDSDIYVNIQSDSVFRAVSLHSKSVCLVSSEIRITEVIEKSISRNYDKAIEVIESKYNWQIPQSIKTQLLQIINEK